MRDLRYAIRVLLKAPVFTATAVLTLALCVGANTAIYTVVDRVLLRPLPYPEPSRLAQVVTHFDRRGDDETGQTGATWERPHEGATALDIAVTSGTSSGVNLVVGDNPEYVKQRRVSAGFFRVLGVTPVIGREFTAEEDRPHGPAVAVLSHALWMRLFNGDASAVGRAVMLRGEPHTIVGVMPERFATSAPADIWTPVRPCRTCEGGGQNYEIVARLASGATWPQADGQVTAIGAPIMRDLYRSNPARLRIVPLRQGQTEDIRRPLMVLWAAVGVVLLIGCVNVAGLLLARGATRAPEIATRIAIGGGRGAIVRQLLAESVVIAAAGAAAGLAIGYASARAFATLLEDAFGVTGQVGLDGRVLAISGGAALVTSVVFGLLPALQASQVDLRRTLVESGSHATAGTARSWPRRTMVAVEIALGSSCSWEPGF
jgi:predicted permease